MRFPILRTASRYPVQKQIDISIACCVLHNFTRLHNGDMSWPNNDNMEIDPHQITDVPNGDNNYHSDIQAFNYSRDVGNQMRDHIARQMWEQYAARRA
jgi:hypothetical protein